MKFELLCKRYIIIIIIVHEAWNSAKPLGNKYKTQATMNSKQVQDTGYNE